MYVKLISYTPNPENLIATSAKLCYSSSSINDILNFSNKDSIENFINGLIELGHESPLEHITFTFGIEDVSRSLLAQLTRHRIASYSVQSQRYVESTTTNYVIPPEIECIHEAKIEFLNIMEECKKSYDKLSQLLKNKYSSISLNENQSNKKAIEDARYVLPNAWCTKIVCTFNARSLINFFNIRCCNRAQWEIKELACLMLTEVKKVAPNIFNKAGPKCLKEKCPEGKMSCGKMKEVKLFFENLV